MINNMKEFFLKWLGYETPDLTITQECFRYKNGGYLGKKSYKGELKDAYFNDNFNQWEAETFLNKQKREAIYWDYEVTIVELTYKIKGAWQVSRW